MKDPYGYVYKITNKLNNKIYIGQKRSSSLVESYWGSGKYILISIAKYGLENFEREIVEWCYSREELNERECYWIRLLNSQDPTIGYNVASGGEGGDIYATLPPEQMEEVRKKLSIYYSHTPEEISVWKEHLRDAHGGKNNCMYGKHHSVEARKKMSEAKQGYVPWNKGVPMSEETRQKLKETLRKKKLAKNQL